ncbi:MAG: hypothetical protein JW966_12170 [Anaerolineae bacterium]|nr:hypothetical protein [Anaerolineae bacterium]
MSKKLTVPVMVLTLSAVVLLAAAVSWPVAVSAQDSTPPPPTYTTTRAAFMRFEKGYMFWLDDSKEVFVMPGYTDLNGPLSVYSDTWQDGMPEVDASLEVPPGLIQPDRGFGIVWRNNPQVRDALGWAKDRAHGYTALVVRDNGRILISCPDNRVYELYNGEWKSIDYYYQEQ